MEAKHFRAAAYKHEIKSWNLHECSICKHPCGFRFREDGVFYDLRCRCFTGGWWCPRTWQDVANHYNMQSAEVKNEYDAFWGFTERNRIKPINKQSK